MSDREVSAGDEAFLSAVARFYPVGYVFFVSYGSGTSKATVVGGPAPLKGRMTHIPVVVRAVQL